MLDNDNTGLGGYINELTDRQGVSVVTVSDGWVFYWTADKLRSMLEAALESETGKLAVFVQSSAKVNKPSN